MPTPTDLLAQLAATAHAFRNVALVWHLAVIAALALVRLGAWSPRNPHAAWLSGAPVVSAAMLALASHNPFNAVVLGVVAIALAAIAGALPERPWASPAPTWRAIGLLTVGYALAYPHFVQIATWSDFAFAPTGVLPCPSLALTLGFALLAEGFGSKAWSLVAAAAGAAYGVFGVVRLGVWLDLGLIAAAIALAARAARLPAPEAAAQRWA